MNIETMTKTDINLLLDRIKSYCKQWQNESKVAKEVMNDVDNIMAKINGVKANVVVKK